MKKTILIALLFTGAFCKAQAPANAPIIAFSNLTEESYTIPHTGTYFKDVDNMLDKWVGTWQYSNGNTIFKIVIQKIAGKYMPAGTHNIPISCYMDLLVGGYYCQENGVVKTNHLSYSDVLKPPLDIGGRSLTSASIFYSEIDKRPNLTGGFVDFTLLSGSTTQAKWEFDPAYKRNFSVPDNVVLTKQ